MKYFLQIGSVWLLLFVFFDGVGQSSTLKECGTREPTKEEMIEIIKQEKAFKQSLGNTTNLVGPITVYIKFHNVLKSDGTGRNISSSISTILSNLNQKYTSVNINFEQSGEIDYIYSSRFYNFHSEGCNGINDEFDIRNGKDVTNAINIYFTGTISKYSSCTALNGYVKDFPTINNPKSSNAIFLKTEGSDWLSTIIQETTPHEMGHYFNLYHTFGEDYVDDTPTDPNLPACVSSSCIWTCSSYNPDVRNLMSYYHGCRNRFTFGQYQRIEDYGKTYRTNLNPSLSQRYYLDGLNRTILQFYGSSSSLSCSGDNLTMQFNSYGDPSFYQGTFYLQMKPINNYYFGVISSTGVTSVDGQVVITGMIPSNTQAGYYKVRIAKASQIISESAIAEQTIYINGTTNGIPTGSPIYSQYSNATSTNYNATSTCVGNNIALYANVSGYDTYWWTKDGQKMDKILRHLQRIVTLTPHQQELIP